MISDNVYDILYLKKKNWMGVEPQNLSPGYGFS